MPQKLVIVISLLHLHHHQQILALLQDGLVITIAMMKITMRNVAGMVVTVVVIMSTHNTVLYVNAWIQMVVEEKLLNHQPIQQLIQAIQQPIPEIQQPIHQHHPHLQENVVCITFCYLILKLY